MATLIETPAWRPVDRFKALRKLLVPIVVVLAILLPLLQGDSFSLLRDQLVLMYVLVAIGLNFSFGFAGELSLAQPAVMGSAAYAAALLSVKRGWNPYETLISALVVGAIVGVVVSLPGIRLRGWYMAITTFFATAIFASVIQSDWRLTGGSDGLVGIAPLPSFISSRASRQYEFVLILTCLVLFAVNRIAKSRFGLSLRSLRDAPLSVEACGRNPLRIKLMVALLSSLPVALSGWLWVHVNQFVAPSSFGTDLLLLVLAAVLLGGRGTVWGPVFGVVVYEVLNLWIIPFSASSQIVVGLGILIFAAAIPQGVVPFVRELGRSRGARVADAGGRGVPAARDRNERRDAATTTVEREYPDRPAVMVEDVKKSFGGVAVLKDVTFEIRHGQVFGLIGPNGSGKTTLLNILTGFVRADEGRVVVEGVELRGLRPYRIASFGIRRTFQVPQLVGELTVADNIVLGASGRGSRSKFRGRVKEVCVQLGLEDVEQVHVSELPLGTRRIIEIGRAMIASGSLVCLDEPAAGLSGDDLETVMTRLRALADAGFAVLLIEHNLSFVYDVCDEVVTIEDGVLKPAPQLVSTRP